VPQEKEVATKNYKCVIIPFHDSVQHINSPAQILSVLKLP
jgi:hypothetical protein